jgi:hypothetical protein
MSQFWQNTDTDSKVAQHLWISSSKILPIGATDRGAPYRPRAPAKVDMPPLTAFQKPQADGGGGNVVAE